jgi:dTDP-6-deoxy-L-talose 4-dehydrogenase (NAD+)
MGTPSVVVTGASGFVGRAVLAALASHGVRPTAITRDRRRLSDLEQYAAIIEGDIGVPDTAFIAEIARHDILLHLAWDGLPNYKSLHHFETELPAQYRFLKAVVAAGSRAIVVAGTCFEYGMQEGRLVENAPAQPTNPYGYAKDALRRQLMFLKQETPFALTWPRLFYMYGRGQNPKSIYSQLAAAIARGDEHFDMSAGEQIRDYLPIDSAADRLARLALLGREGGVVNICSGEPRSMRSIVESWLRDNGWRIALRLGEYPYPDYEPFAFWGSAEKLREVLNERPIE